MVSTRDICCALSAGSILKASRCACMGTKRIGTAVQTIKLSKN